METIISQFRLVSKIAEKKSLSSNSKTFIVWCFKQIPSYVALDLCLKIKDTIYSNGGWLFRCHRYTPTISTSQILSINEIIQIANSKPTIDVYYLPVRPCLCKDLLAVAYNIADIDFNFNGFKDDIINFFSNLSNICKFIPAEIDSSLIVGDLKEVVNISLLRNYLNNSYIPLMRILGILEFSPTTVVSETLNSMSIYLSYEQRRLSGSDQPNFNTQNHVI